MEFHIRKILIIIFIIFYSESSSYASNTDDFTNSIKNQDTENAIELIKETIAIDDPNYIIINAQRYAKQGKYDEAIKWYEKAHQNKSLLGRFQLAQILLQYKEDNKSHERSANLFESFSIEDGKQIYSDALYSLGQIYLLGRGRERNNSKAFDFTYKSHTYDNPFATYMLSILYHQGIGTEIDLINSASLTGKLANLGFVESESDYAHMILNEMGVKKDNRIAALWLKRAADKGYPRALQTLSRMYFDGLGVKKDNIESYKLYLLAKEAGIMDIELDMILANIKENEKKEATDRADSFQKLETKSLGSANTILVR